VKTLLENESLVSLKEIEALRLKAFLGYAIINPLSETVEIHDNPINLRSLNPSILAKLEKSVEARTVLNRDPETAMVFMVKGSLIDRSCLTTDLKTPDFKILRTIGEIVILILILLNGQHRIELLRRLVTGLKKSISELEEEGLQGRENELNKKEAELQKLSSGWLCLLYDEGE
jgi:hypothetical protein